MGVTDTGQYGHLYGTSEHQDGLTATFDGTGTDLILSVDGYDIDYDDEVAVSLNGVLLGYLSKGTNNGLNGGDTFPIPASQQMAGKNKLTFEQARALRWKWGVTNLLVDFDGGQ